MYVNIKIPSAFQKLTVGKFLLNPEILCLLFKQCCQIQSFVNGKIIEVLDNSIVVYKILDLATLLEK